MIVNQSTVTRLEITELQKLDPIRVYIEDYEPGKGRITISCYDGAWVGYWGGMGKRTLSQFFTCCDAEYLAGNLGCASTLRQNESSRKYLIRIIEAVQQALKGGSHAG
jgi:hypothetical protein